MARAKKYTSENPGYEAVKTYREKNKTVRIPLDMPGDEAAALRKYCDDNGVKVATFIRRLIDEAIDYSGVQAPACPVGDIDSAAAGRVTSASTPKE